ncbi:hypothetical protein EUX98_g7576 [Antrodiella citrinella]|uniref:non-specific serine/threonine protein kinase n=1 Tax=Antrodiella citrinella TaxID=2447956 RepID=A0A4S4MLH3_9APHY|nr:hypothetical protein EUX98_g7576 [Antrodiella citrinella]
MAQPQGFPAQAPSSNKGTLMPGQTIAVNKYTVQVDRYLSQGGFAHVYLVRTAQPVYGTTHHVLKRIAVPNESMLTEVKKEVDIMRILKGHPNIVHLIDAAWHRMSNGVYEVFILMEFCSGGGIIDMMNRRLRERLTEPEILTIFVEVCEGLAAMHSLKPPLLHRDLKVENILQASAMSYKLCDFGSATAVQKIPSNSQELRALEADLNRHTTLQYRAPEMVDVHMRRPIDEKSDVWALGVLLYKLCYYTTPFEEHGPLAILNVQYKIPPYPVYSQHMNALIASMLREHGAQRPTVFEILTHVHALRGTKSRFTYAIPSKQQSIPPRATQQQPYPPLQSLSPNILLPAPVPVNPLDDLVTYKSRTQQSSSPARNAGVEARDKVLEAIAPMRRGRPTVTPGSVITPPPSPQKDRTSKALTDTKFGADGDRAWGGIRGHKSGMASYGGSSSQPKMDAWGMTSQQKDERDDKPERKFTGFDSDFSSFGKGFGDTFEPSRSPLPPSSPAQPPPHAKSQPIPIAPISRPSRSPGDLSPSASPSKKVPLSRSQPKDAFDGLGIPSQPPPQTLGDARRTRTGSGITSAASPEPSANLKRASTQYLIAPSSNGMPGLGTSNTTYRPPSAHSPAPSTSSKQAESWRSSPHARAPSSSRQLGELTAEEKFPSLEDLDRKFSSPSPAPSARGSFGPRVPSQPSSNEKLNEKSVPATAPTRPLSRAGMQLGVPPRQTLGSTGTGATTAVGVSSSAGAGRYDGVRSQHVTGSAMRESRMSAARLSTADWSRGDYNDYVSTKEKDGRSSSRPPSGSSSNPVSRPVPRRHRSSLTVKSPTQSSPPEVLSSGPTPHSQANSRSSDAPPRLPPRPLAIPIPGQEPRDWLTGNSDESQEVTVPPPAQGEPILRESPSKRASFFERSPVLMQKALEAENVAVSGHWPSVEELEKGGSVGFKEKERESEKEQEREKERERDQKRRRDKERQRQKEKDSLEERQRQYEEEKEKSRLREERDREKAKQREREKEREREEKEQPMPQAKPSRFIARPGLGSNNTGSSTRGLQLPALDTKRSSAPSPSGLTDNWSPVGPPSGPPSRKGSSSSSDGGPEDVSGYQPTGGARETVKEPSKLRDQLVERNPDDSPRRKRTKSNSRQSSVHNLVDLWGGGLEKEKEKSVIAPKSPEKRRSVIVPATRVKQPVFAEQSRSASPAPLAAPSTTPGVTTSRLNSTRPPSRTQGHRKETTGHLPPGARALPAPIPTTTSGRVRPQSMLIGAVSKSISSEQITSVISPNAASSSLSPPAPDARAKRSERRSSISDMVQKYEAYKGARPGPGAPAPKPAGLSVKTPNGNDGSLSVGVSSPATAASRFPRLSPTSSPIMANANLAVPDDSKEQARAGRTSPISGLPGRSSPAPSLSRFEKNTPAVNGLPSRNGPPDSGKVFSTSASATPTIERPIPRKATASAPPPPEERSASPEKPFQGVSRLIDRWNRAVEGSGDAAVAKKVGAEGSLSGRR